MLQVSAAGKRCGEALQGSAAGKHLGKHWGKVGEALGVSPAKKPCGKGSREVQKGNNKRPISAVGIV